MRRTRCATGRTPACTRAVSTSGHSPDTPGRVSPGDTPDAVPSFRRGPWVQSPQWPSRSPCWRSDCATRGRSGPASGGARTMARIDSQAEAWTTTLRAEQAALDIGAELGPADPTAYTMRRPIREPMPMERHGPARIIAMANQKGGVGKTTTTINLGAALAEYGRRTLLVDFDPQGALSVGLGVNPHNLDLSVYNLLMHDDCTLDDVRIKTNLDGLHLLPSNIDLSAAEIQLVTEVAREMALARVLRPVLKEYDYILIDCQPSLGLLAINALTVAHGVLIPLECEFFSLRGVALLLDTIDKVRERLNFDLELEGILATMYDSCTTHCRQVLQRVVEAFGDKVYQTVITRTVKFPESTVAGAPITSLDPSSSGARNYRQLAREVIAAHAERRAAF